MSRVLKLTLAYDGTAYLGWQRQSRGPSIQGLVEEALSRIEGAPVTLHGAGRTDAGVHATGQVASASVSTSLDATRLRRALNAILPPDVRVTAAQDAPPGFHARYHATRKTYQYWIWQGDVLPPFLRASCWHIARTLDMAAMERAARLLEGRHDFAAFQSAGGAVKTSVRTVASARVHLDRAAEAPGSAPGPTPPLPSGGVAIVVEIAADGFLRHMVRAIVGTLVEVGDRRRDPASIRTLLDGGDRAQAGPTAPARGLFLVRVDY